MHVYTPTSAEHMDYLDLVTMAIDVIMIRYLSEFHTNVARVADSIEQAYVDRSTHSSSSDQKLVSVTCRPRIEQPMFPRLGCRDRSN